MRKELGKLGNFRAFCELEHSSSLEYLKIYEVKKGTSTLKALYRGRKWVGILPLKILGKTSAVGLVPYRWIRGT